LGKAEPDTEAETETAETETAETETAEAETARYPRIQKIQHSSLLLRSLEPARTKERHVGKPYSKGPRTRKKQDQER
jgi:hypothetical protein